MDKPVSNIKLGIACIIASAFCFSLMSLFIRLSGDVPVMQKCFFRNAVAFVMAAVVMIRARQPFVVEPGNWKYMLIRAGAGTLGIALNFYAVDHLAISDASILNKLSPFFAIIFSTLVLKEVAKAGEWIAVAVAFLGAVFVIKPGLGMMASLPALIGAGSGCFAGLAYTYLRKLRQRGHRLFLLRILQFVLPALPDLRLSAHRGLAVGIPVPDGGGSYGGPDLHHKSLCLRAGQGDLCL